MSQRFDARAVARLIFVASDHMTGDVDRVIKKDSPWK